MPGSKESQPLRLLDELRRVLRLNHYSIHTERSYIEWIVRFHGIRSREALFFAEKKIMDAVRAGRQRGARRREPPG